MQRCRFVTSTKQAAAMIIISKHCNTAHLHWKQQAGARHCTICGRFRTVAAAVRRHERLRTQRLVALREDVFGAKTFVPASLLLSLQHRLHVHSVGHA
jgi:hypothetical protein